MKEHFSVAGTTCWFCGHPAGSGNRVRKALGETIYLACRDCHHAPAGEEVERRDADVEGMKEVLEGREYVPEYFTRGNFDARVEEFRGWAPEFLDALKSREYEDALARPTQVRLEVAAKEYAKNYREGRKAVLHQQYHEGGGKERAAARYREVKDAQPEKVKKVLTGEEREAKRLAACEYSKEWYKRKKAAEAVEIMDSFNQEGTGI